MKIIDIHEFLNVHPVKIGDPPALVHLPFYAPENLNEFDVYEHLGLSTSDLGDDPLRTALTRASLLLAAFSSADEYGKTGVTIAAVARLTGEHPEESAPLLVGLHNLIPHADRRCRDMLPTELVQTEPLL